MEKPSLEVRKCYNKYCQKELIEEDFPNGYYFGKWHLCKQCFFKFDSQKMRGRGFNTPGILGPEVVKGLIELGHSMSWDLAERPGEETTESIDQWVEWQKPQ